MAVAVLVLIPLGPPATAHAAAPTCQGATATIVGKPGKTLNGTAGPDVMVSRGASFVHGGDGNDLVCITGSTDDGYRVRVSGGNGDDSVTVTTSNAVRTYLGDGEDSYAGGGERDFVFGGDYDDDEFRDYRDDDTDSIGTGGGDDEVDVSNDDTLSLGRGDDVATWKVAPGAPAANVDGGAGRNTLVLIGYTDLVGQGATWLLDTRTRTLTRDGEVVVSFAGFPHIYPHVPGDLDVRGSKLDEKFSVVPGSSYGTAGSSFAIHAGGGDDEIEVLANDLDLVTRALDGGPGRDLLHVRGWDFVPASVVVDLAVGSYRYRDSEGRSKAGFVGIEDAEVQEIPEVTMRGDASANRLTVHADQTEWPRFKNCQVAMSGRGGNDRLRMSSSKVEDSWRKCPAPVLRGDSGNDQLVGSLLGEKLLGGPGRDVARGGPGRDVCIAETRVGCESR